MRAVDAGDGFAQASLDSFGAITKHDIGKAVSIQHGNLRVGYSQQRRIVEWGDAKHHDCTGIITSVEGKYLGTVQLDNGQKFENPMHGDSATRSMLKIGHERAEFDECYLESSMV